MTVDEAISDLLSISTDIRRVAVLGTLGEVIGARPGQVADDFPEAAAQLWEAAAACAATLSDAALEHIVVQSAGGAVAVLEAHGRRIVAATWAQPAIGLLVFDLRTCLSDAFAGEEPA